MSSQQPPQTQTVLSLGLPFMDDNHQEFDDMLSQALLASDTELLAEWQALINHATLHFGMEDEWMAASHYASAKNHQTQHLVVLQVMLEGLQRGQQGEFDAVRQMVCELKNWFGHHTQSLDAALALHLRSVGTRPEDGFVPSPNNRHWDRRGGGIVERQPL
jgi:hemerythrin-like metal-binding protein